MGRVGTCRPRRVPAAPQPIEYAALRVEAVPQLGTGDGRWFHRLTAHHHAVDPPVFDGPSARQIWSGILENRYR